MPDYNALSDVSVCQVESHKVAFSLAFYRPSRQAVLNFNDPFWGEFERVLTGLDLDQTLSQQPQLVAAAVFRLPDPSTLIQRQHTFETISLSMWFSAVAACQQMWSQLGAKEFGDDYIKDRLSAVRDAIPSLSLTMEWIRFACLQERSESVTKVALAQSLGLIELIDEFRSGADSVLQRELLRTHYASKVWPSSHLFLRALAAFYKRVSPDLHARIELACSADQHSIFWNALEDHKCTVVNLPVLLGFWSMTGVTMDWWCRAGRIAQLAEIRKFDPIWFQTAYYQGVKFALVMNVQATVQGEMN